MMVISKDTLLYLIKKLITLVPLSLRQMYNDQVKLKKESDMKKESESVKSRGDETKNSEKWKEVPINGERKKRK